MEDHPPAVVLVPASADSAALVDPGTATGRASLARSGGVVVPALTLVNAIGYVLTVTAARALDQGAYGELNALLGVLLVVCVPALAVQAVVARSIARRPADEARGPRERALLVRSALVGLGVAAVVAAGTPLLAAFLHTGTAGPLWVAAQLAPFAVLSAAMGVLQGKERFTALAVVICVQALGKGLGVLPLLASGGPTAVLAVLTGGTVLAMVVALVLVGRGVPGPAPASLPTAREGVVALTGLLALLLLANLDLLLARHVLPGDESGRYSAGTVLAKAAFWLPQAVAVVVFPRLTDPEGGRRLLRQSALLVGGLGVVEVLGCLLLARPVLELTFGQTYGSLAPIAPLWVLQGAALSVVQLLVYRAIATRDAVTSRLVGLAVVVEVVVVLAVRPDRPGPVIALATLVALVLTVALVLRAMLTRPRDQT